MVSPAHAVTPNDTVYGCPSGAVCIYPRDQIYWLDPYPEAVYWSYGYHNLSNEYGDHWVVNNQTGGATVDLCDGYNGTNCVQHQNFFAGDYDLTPINSIVLNR